MGYYLKEEFPLKTLKKTLALMLVVAMMFSFGVIGASAAFDDAKDVNADYAEAVEVMSDLGIIKGLTDTTFGHDSTLTRAQACMFIARITLGTDTAAKLTASSKSFTDVAADYWGYDVIEYCYNAGLIAGYGDGKFGPDDALSSYAFAKMLMAALGVDVSACTGANWQIETAKLSIKTGFSSIVLTAGDFTREVAAQMIYDALFYASDATEGYGVYKNGTLVAYYESAGEAATQAALLDALDSVTTNVYTNDTSAVTIKSGNTLAKTVFGVTRASSYDKFGRPATVYSVTAYSAAKNIKVAASYGWSTTKSVASDAVKTYSAADFTTNEYVALGKAAWDFSGAAVYYNGATGVLTLSDVAAGNLARPGYIVEVFGKANTNGGYTVSRVVVIEYYLAEVTDIAAKTGNITLQIREAGYYYSHSNAYKSVTIAAPTASNVTPSANYKALSSLAENDVVLVCVLPGWETALTILDVMAPTVVTGTVTATNYTGHYNGYIKIDGTKSTFAWEYDQTAISLGGKYDFYTDASGYVYGASVVSEATTDLAYVLETNAYKAATFAGTSYAKASVVFDNGTVSVVDIYVTSTGYINGNTSDPMSGYTTAKATAIAADTWYSYAKQDDGTYKFVALPTGYANGSVSITKATATVAGAGKNATAATTLSVVYYNATTKTATVSDYTGYANFPTCSGTAAYKVNSNTGFIDDIVVFTTTSVTSSAKFGLYVGLGDYDADGQHYNFVVDSAIVSYTRTDSIGALTAGTVYQVTASGTTAAVAAVSGSYTAVTGSVTSVEPNNAYIVVGGITYYAATTSTYTSVVGLASGTAPSAENPAVGDTITMVVYTKGGFTYVADAFITANA